MHIFACKIPIKLSRRLGSFSLVVVTIYHWRAFISIFLYHFWLFFHFMEFDTIRCDLTLNSFYDVDRKQILSVNVFSWALDSCHFRALFKFNQRNPMWGQYRGISTYDATYRRIVQKLVISLLFMFSYLSLESELKIILTTSLRMFVSLSLPNSHIKILDIQMCILIYRFNTIRNIFMTNTKQFGWDWTMAIKSKDNSTSRGGRHNVRRVESCHNSWHSGIPK